MSRAIGRFLVGWGVGGCKFLANPRKKNIEDVK
jgi:hypothetical protein